jgi:hypothetical protein
MCALIRGGSSRDLALDYARSLAHMCADALVVGDELPEELAKAIAEWQL